MDMNRDPTYSEKQPASNITTEELDAETIEKLRGDAIGSTMYSEVFVLNTLLQFSDLQWSEEVEDKLSFLWDMTVEKDICEYLFKASYVPLACSALEKYNEPRFVEIVVGILANLLCSECDKQIESGQVKAVLALLNHDDPYILIQVMRFILAVSNLFQSLDFIEAQHITKFDFILNYSTNKELLSITLKTLAAITADRKINSSILRGELLMSAITAYKELKCESESYDEHFESQETHLNIKYLIEFLCNMCSYIDVLQINDFRSACVLNLDDFNAEIVPLLNYYTFKNNLLPLNEQLIFYIEALTYIYTVLKVAYNSSISIAVYKLFYFLYKEGLNKMQLLVELVCYLLSVGNLEEIKDDFHTVSLELGNVKKAFSFIINSHKLELENVDKLREILDNM